VILPEVDHHLDKLSLAHHSPRNLGGLQVGHDPLKLARRTSLVGIGAISSSRAIAHRRVASHPLSLPPRSAYFGEQRDDLTRLRVEHLETLDRLHTGIVADSLWLELSRDPPIDARRPYLCGVGGARAKREPTQGVGYLLIRRELAISGNGDGSRRSIVIAPRDRARGAPRKGERYRNRGSLSHMADWCHWRELRCEDARETPHFGHR
jgi:hypothetical protein